jgi:hypothetical protein
MLIKTKKPTLSKTEIKDVQNPTLINLEIIAPELIELPVLSSGLKILKLNTPKLNFKDFSISSIMLDILKIKGSGQSLKLSALPSTLRMIYFEDLALDLKTSPLEALIELTMINCQLKQFPLKEKDLVRLGRLVLDDNFLSEIPAEILSREALNHFSIDNNPLSDNFKNWLEKKFPHRF